MNEQIAANAEKMVQIEKEKISANKKMELMEQEVKEMRESDDLLNSLVEAE